MVSNTRKKIIFDELMYKCNEKINQGEHVLHDLDVYDVQSKLKDEHDILVTYEEIKSMMQDIAELDK